MDEDEAEVKSYCRQCGGDRYHTVFAEKSRTWAEDSPPIDGGDRWAIVECAGCHTITFIHSHWFSEDIEYTEEGAIPIMHRDLYPPAPSRKKPEWGTKLFLALTIDELWIERLLDDVYAATGLGAYSLAAMGARTILDHVITSKAGDRGGFKDKLDRLVGLKLITETQSELIYAAFDAGSAAAHRGYSPSQADIYMLLDVAESLIQQIYINPGDERRQAEAAAALRAKTPKREKPKRRGEPK